MPDPEEANSSTHQEKKLDHSVLIVGVLISIISLFVGLVIGWLTPEKSSGLEAEELKTCRADLKQAHDNWIDSVKQMNQWVELVGKFANQQKVTVELVQSRLGITPQMIAEAVKRDEVSKDASK